MALHDLLPSPPYVRPEHLHVTTVYLGGVLAAEQKRPLLASSRRLHREAAAFDFVITHVVIARGALALAVVDKAALVGAGLPLEDGARPHITLRTRPPWRPRHSNEVLAAIASARTCGVQEAVPFDMQIEQSLLDRWRTVRVGEALLEVFVHRFEQPLQLQGNELCLF